MNGQPLSVRRGYPVRAVIPGVIGARWVKWLDHITVQAEESTNHYQRRDYKVLPAEVTDSQMAEAYWDCVPAVDDMPVNSAIAMPVGNEIVELPTSGRIEVRGYALPQGLDGPVTRVEVSADAGRSWVEAELVDSEKPNRASWVLWKSSVPAARGSGMELQSRATDARGNTQLEHSQWNLRGVGYNGYGVSRDLTIV
jgi:sulfite oxidase